MYNHKSIVGWVAACCEDEGSYLSCTCSSQELPWCFCFKNVETNSILHFGQFGSAIINHDPSPAPTHRFNEDILGVLLIWLVLPLAKIMFMTKSSLDPLWSIACNWFENLLFVFFFFDSENKYGVYSKVTRPWF